MNLTENQKKYLRGLGHKINPTIIVGDKGVTDALLAEYESTLAHHELIKVRIRAGDRESRDQMIDTLCSTADATLVQRVGNIALLYRENPERASIRLPR